MTEPAKSINRILAIWLPNWPVQRLVSTRPELQNQAVVLYHSISRGRCVAACSDAARELGVQKDLPVAEVAALVRRNYGRKSCAAPLHLEPFDPKADRFALEKLAGWCQQYSPCVGLEDIDVPETLLLDVTGIAPLFGSEQVLVDQVATSFRRLHLTAQLALANTIGAAWAVSHYGCRNPTVAETTVVEFDDRCTTLHALPIAALRLPPTIIETLARLGVLRIGELLMLPRKELHARFAPILLKRLDQALAAVPETIDIVHPPTEFTVDWSLEHPVDRRDTINRVIEQLVERLAQKLAGAGQGALQLVCRLHCRPAPDVHVQIGLHQPSANTRHLLELIGMQMEHAKLPGPVNAVRVRVTEHAYLECRQQGLFDQGERKSDSPQIASLIDRLTSRLGREAVVHCVLQSDAQPEKAYRQQPLVDRSPQQRKSNSTNLSLAPLDRPLHVFRRPFRLQVFTVVPAATPMRFCYHGRDHYVARHWGPERIETGWWRRRGVQRDYYRVETKSGHRFWLFRQTRSGEWFLHGVF